MVDLHDSSRGWPTANKTVTLIEQSHKTHSIVICYYQKTKQTSILNIQNEVGINEKHWNKMMVLHIAQWENPYIGMLLMIKLTIFHVELDETLWHLYECIGLLSHLRRSPGLPCEPLQSYYPMLVSLLYHVYLISNRPDLVTRQHSKQAIIGIIRKKCYLYKDSTWGVSKRSKTHAWSTEYLV